MGKRRDGRMAAIQYLFANDLHKTADDPATRDAFWTLHSAKGGTRQFAEQLIDGVLHSRDDLDGKIIPLLENFRLERLAAVDRNVLRLATYELLNCPDLPAAVILNEAIDIAKMLSAGESGSFVNAILHKLAQTLRPATDSTPAPADA